MGDLFGNSFIDDVRKAWQSDIWEKDGAICPVCDRLGKVYARRFGYPMARSLVWLYVKTNAGNWCHVPSEGDRYVLRTNQWGHLVKFGVIEAMPPEDMNEKRHSGYYRITEYGVRVVESRSKIPEYIFTYNDERLDAKGDIREITIYQGLGSHGFNFEEIMQAATKTFYRQLEKA